MRHFPARYSRFVLFLLIVAAPVSATIAFERAAQASRPPAIEPRATAPGTPAGSDLRAQGSGPLEPIGSKATK